MDLIIDEAMNTIKMRIDDELKKAYRKGYEDGKHDAVVHAHWEDVGHLYGKENVGAATCPICGGITLWFNPEEFTPERCCWCGVIMDEEV